MIALLGAIASIVVLWVLATPPSAGPDEPSHVVRAAALVRGQLDGAPVDGSLVAFDLPAHIAFPDPGCFAFLEDVPASCATSIDRPNGSRPLLTAATHYPVWGHLVAGIGSFLPAEFAGPGTRMIDAIIPLGLLGLALIAAARRGWLVAGAVLLCATPPVWFIIAVVNPSHYVITGGVAVWIALSGFRRRITGQVMGSPLTRLDSLLLGAGWAAMVLPRRDGLLYASLVLALAILIFGIPTCDVGVAALGAGNDGARHPGDLGVGGGQFIRLVAAAVCIGLASLRRRRYVPSLAPVRSTTATGRPGRRPDRGRWCGVVRGDGSTGQRLRRHRAAGGDRADRHRPQRGGRCCRLARYGRAADDGDDLAARTRAPRRSSRCRTAPSAVGRRRCGARSCHRRVVGLDHESERRRRNVLAGPLLPSAAGRYSDCVGDVARAARIVGSSGVTSAQWP